MVSTFTPPHPLPLTVCMLPSLIWELGGKSCKIEKLGQRKLNSGWVRKYYFIVKAQLSIQFGSVLFIYFFPLRKHIGIQQNVLKYGAMTASSKSDSLSKE